MKETDLVRLLHMRDYAREVVQFTSGETRASLNHDTKLVRALCYSIGIIGAAASHISPELRAETHQIPWRKIIDMRNFLVHVYFRLDDNILWETATQAVPELIPLLEALLREQDPS